MFEYDAMKMLLIKGYVDCIVNTKRIPENLIEDMLKVTEKDHQMMYHFRSEYTKRVSYPIIDMKFIDPFSDFLKGHKVLEVMCGSGFLAHALREQGIDVTATDNLSWMGERRGYIKHYTSTFIDDIINLDGVDAVKKYGSQVDCIIMSWPPYKDDKAYDILMEMRKRNKDCIMIYIGECEYGCTASPKFFKAAHFIAGKETGRLRSFGFNPELWELACSEFRHYIYPSIYDDVWVVI